MLQVHVIDLLFSTTNGLYRFSNGTTFCLSHGDYFGITQLQDDIWVAANRQKQTLDVFDISTSRLVDRRPGITKHTHQIDLIDGRLLAVTTDNNSITVFDDALKKDYEIFPNGIAVRGEANFCHFNSIYGVGSNVYLIAHNLGEYTGKNSELFVLESDLRFKSRSSLGSFSCHNYVLFDGMAYICHSKNSTVERDGVVIHKHDGYFTRGLSINKHVVAYGINKASKESGERLGKVVVRSNIKSFEIDADAPVNDIRQIRVDYGLSQHASI